MRAISPKVVGTRLLRLLAPFLAYTLLYATHAHLARGEALRPVTSYLFEPAEYHLWFFAPMLLMGILSALLRPAANHRFGLGLALGLLLLCNAHSFRALGLPGPLDHELSLLANLNQVGVLLGWFLLALVGYHLGSLTPPRWVVAASVLGFLGLTLFITWATVQAGPGGPGVLGWLDDLNFAVLLHAVCLFVAARAVMPTLQSVGWVARVLQALSSRSLGVYGLHVLVLGWLGMAGSQAWVSGHPWLALPLVALLATFVSWGIARGIALVDRRGLVV